MQQILLTGLTEPYISGVNDCDIWIQNKFALTGLCLAPLWGDAYDTNVQGHYNKLYNAGLLKDALDVAYYNIFLVDLEPEDSIYDHDGVIYTHSDGSITIFNHGGSPHDSQPYEYNSINAFMNRPTWRGHYVFWNPWR